MINNREKDSALAYKLASREDKKEIITFASCDDGATRGLLHYYMMKDAEQLAMFKRRKVKTRGEKVKRKADFYFVLARMAERLDRIKELTPW